MSRAWLLPISIAALAVLVVAGLGMTVVETGGWYHALARPRWSPSDAAFGAGWTAIYASGAVAGVTGWLATPSWREREWLLGLFALNGFLAILWSLLFFRAHRPDWALVEAIGLWVSALALVIAIWRQSMTGAILMLPYLGWATFLGYLTMTIVRLNGPFR